MAKPNVELGKTVHHQKQSSIVTLFEHSNMQLHVVCILLLIKAEG